MDREDELTQRVSAGCPVPAGFLWCLVFVGGAKLAWWDDCFELWSVLRNVHGVCQGEELGKVLSISKAYGKVAGEAEETQLGKGTASTWSLGSGWEGCE